MHRRLGRRRIYRLAGLRIQATGIASRVKRRWIFTASGRRFTSTTAIACSARKSITRSKARRKRKSRSLKSPAQDVVRDDSLKINAKAPPFAGGSARCKRWGTREKSTSTAKLKTKLTAPRVHGLNVITPKRPV